MTFTTASGRLPAGLLFTSSRGRTELVWKWDIRLVCKALRLKAKHANQIPYCQLPKELKNRGNDFNNLIWAWESFVAAHRSDVEAPVSPIDCRTACGSTRGKTKETKPTPQTWPQKPTPAAQRSSMISSATGFSGTTNILRRSAQRRRCHSCC